MQLTYPANLFFVATVATLDKFCRVLVHALPSLHQMRSCSEVWLIVCCCNQTENKVCHQADVNLIPRQIITPDMS